MRNIFFTLFSAILFSYPIMAQDCDIVLIPLVNHSATAYDTSDVDTYISNRLRNITSNSGNIGALENSQFALLLAYDIVDKQIIDGAPTKIIYSVSANFQVLDLKGNKVYSSLSKSLKGIGNNEQKALINSFQKINNSDTQLQDFIKRGKAKIVEYYNTNYPAIIKEAQALATTRNFDKAIYNLMMIPQCSVGYDEALSVMMNIYQQFVNQHCNENLAQARAAWIASPNNDGAATASIFLSEIYPDATCYSEALELMQEIKKQMGNEWKFQMKQWNDNVSLEQQRINALREIGIAYATSHSVTHPRNHK